MRKCKINEELSKWYDIYLADPKEETRRMLDILEREFERAHDMTFPGTLEQLKGIDSCNGMDARGAWRIFDLCRAKTNAWEACGIMHGIVEVMLAGPGIFANCTPVLVVFSSSRKLLHTGAGPEPRGSAKSAVVHMCRDGGEQTCGH